MLRNLFQLLSPDPRTNGDRNQQPVLLYARLAHDPVTADTTAPSLPSKRSLVELRPNSSHRARLFSMRLEHIQLCSPHRCERLRQLGIVTAGDLASASPDQLAMQFRASRRALRVLKEYRRAIRFAASVTGMMPRDAMLLISIHRRSTHGLSMESAAKLHRDLQRFAQSSQGQLQMRGRRVPSIRRLKQWINECKESSVQSPVHARAA